MFKKYYNDYYRGRINTKEICETEKISTRELSKEMQTLELKTYRRYFKEIKVGDADLNNILKIKYRSIVDRCNGRKSEYKEVYSDMEYLTIIEWVKFCNNNSTRLLTMWEDYLKSGKNYKMTISIDRINSDLGYTADNLQFVTHGFNSWKKSLNRPIKTKRMNGTKWHYFMTCEEGGKFFNIRKQSLGEILRKTKYHRKDFIVKEASVNEVLSINKCNSLQEYYNKHIL